MLLLLFFFSSFNTGYPNTASSVTQFQQAQDSFQKGDYERAIQLFEEATRISSIASKAAEGLARVLIETGDYKRAELVCQNALASSPRSLELKTALARTFRLTGRYSMARQLLAEVIARDPDQLEARVVLGEMQLEWDERAAARETLEYLISYYRNHAGLSAQELNYIAQACVLLDRVRDANNLFYDATKAEPNLWQVYIPWGELMLQKYNLPDARSIFQDALKINPNSTAANLGLSKSYKYTQFESVTAEKALEVNPNFVAAHDYLAELEIARGKFEEAIERLDKALEVNTNSVTTRTLRAVAFYFSGDSTKFYREERQILAINPKYGDLYYEIAEMLSKRYLFTESVAFYQKALSLNPEHWAAYAGLGTSLSRLGQEKAAKQQLERAFAKDPFNKYVGNLLTLFDEFPDYKTHKTDFLTVRIHKDDDAVLAPYAIALADEGFSNLMKLYKISTDQEVVLEIFPTHDDFAVRCFGLPGAQAFLGICFGNVVAMDSPRARSKGDFVWGETLWHELVHVTHLRLTANRIPRWLAEGIAVFETSVSKPNWRMSLDWPFILAFNNNRLLPLRDLDSGFNSPQSPGQVTLSYFQASIIVEYIVNEYGRDKLTAMFPGFKKGLKTPEVIKTVFNKEIDEFDSAFHDYLRKKYRLDEVDYEYDPGQFSGENEELERKLAKALDEKPNNPFLNFRYGMYYQSIGDMENAITYFEKAKQLFPGFVDHQNPYSALADIYLEKNDKQRAIAELRQLTSINSKDIKTLLKLADLGQELADYETAADALKKALYIDPFDSQIHVNLARAYMAAGHTEQAISELQINLLTNPQDLAGAHCDLAAAYLDAGRKREAKQSALTALEVAPGYERAQEILLASIE